MSRSASTSQSNPKVKLWVKRLTSDHMPSFTQTLTRINSLAVKNDIKVSELTEEILKDPGLTSRILQLANAASDRYVKSKVNTVTRAIVVLGFRYVRDIALSLHILDAMVKQGKASEALMSTIAESFHAAIQARNLMQQCSGEQQEEIFISTLLIRFVQTSVLASDFEESELLQNKIIQEKKLPDEVALEVLGCTFTDISLELAEMWSLTDLFTEYLLGNSPNDMSVQAIDLGLHVAHALAADAFDESHKFIYSDVADFKRINTQEAKSLIQLGVEEAVEMAGILGIEDLVDLVHEMTSIKTFVEVKGAGDKCFTEAVKVPFDDENYMKVLEETDEITDFDLDAHKHIKIIQQLSEWILHPNQSINKVFDYVVEGLHEVLGFERVWLCLMDKQKGNLSPKIISDQTANTMIRCVIPITGSNLFSHVIKNQESLWLSAMNVSERSKLFTEDLQLVLRTKDCLLSPITVCNKPIGVMFADKPGKLLTEQHFSNFSILVSQMNLAVTAATRRF